MQRRGRRIDQLTLAGLISRDRRRLQQRHGRSSNRNIQPSARGMTRSAWLIPASIGETFIAQMSFFDVYAE
jgi:hypothetical protein